RPTGVLVPAAAAGTASRFRAPARSRSGSIHAGGDDRDAPHAGAGAGRALRPGPVGPALRLEAGDDLAAEQKRDRLADCPAGGDHDPALGLAQLVRPQLAKRLLGQGQLALDLFSARRFHAPTDSSKAASSARAELGPGRGPGPG